MTTTIKHVTLKSLSKNKDIDPSKGTVVNPFTQEEYNSLCNTGTWPGGYVEAMGYIAPPMMDGMDSWGGSGSDGSSPYDIIPLEILQALPSALSNLITSGEVGVILDPALDVPGRYYIATKTIRLRPNGINLETIRHELFHAWQHKQGYMDGQSHTNNEYETYVINDVIYYMTNMVGEYGSLAGGTVTDEDYSNYYNFIATSVGTGTFNANYFLAHVSEFYESFKAAHSNSPAGNGTSNSGYQWHWQEILLLFGLIQS